MANRIFSVGPSPTAAIPFLVDFKNVTFVFVFMKKVGKCGNMVVFTATPLHPCCQIASCSFSGLIYVHNNILMEDVSALEMVVSS